MRHRAPFAPSLVIAATAVLIALALLLTGCGGGGGIAPSRQAEPLDTGQPPVADSGYATPDKAVDAWYAALKKNTVDAMKAVSTPDLAANLDEGAFQGRTVVVTYKILASSAEGSEGSVDVRETQKGKKPAVVTYVVTKGPKGWLVNGFTPSFTAVGGDSGGPQNETPAGVP